MKYIIYSWLFITLVVIEIRAYCNTYFNWETLHKLWKNYINPENISYGLWDNDDTIEKANKNLYDLMYKKANINKTHSVLHVGNIKIKNKSKTKTKENKKWDRIIAIEPESISELSNKLKKGGILVYSTIVLKDNTPSSFYIDTICDFLCIPKITYSELKIKLENIFTLAKIQDCTENTINPYYRYLFNTFITKKQLPQWVADILIYYFHSSQFQYIIYVCR